MSTSFFEGVEKLLEVWFQRPQIDNRAGSNDCRSDLRRIPRSELDSLVASAHCRIISSLSNDHMDSYVLSESSMFVSSSRFILKTCGRTTPLSCLNHLLDLVTRYTSYTTVKDLFYSRKNFVCPNLQETTYRSFDAEIAVLQRLFPAGSAYCLGRINSDCWYIYTLDRPQNICDNLSIDSWQDDNKTDTINNKSNGNIVSVNGSTSCVDQNSNVIGNTNGCYNNTSAPFSSSTSNNVVNHFNAIKISSNTSISSDNNNNKIDTSINNTKVIYNNDTYKISCDTYISSFSNNGGKHVSNADTLVNEAPASLISTESPDSLGDQTLEILMHDLDSRVMSAFHSGPGRTADEVTQRVGIDKLVEGMKIDATLFEPCGYSMNALLDKAHYLTIHVTPEPGFSYVSLETNLSAASYQDLISRVVACFRPRRTLVTLFANDLSEACGFVRAMSIKPHPPYLLNARDLQYSRLRDYHLLYAFFDC